MTAYGRQLKQDRQRKPAGRMRFAVPDERAESGNGHTKSRRKSCEDKAVDRIAVPIPRQMRSDPEMDR